MLGAHRTTTIGRIAMLVALLAMIAASLPAAPASAQASPYTIANACPPETVPSSGFVDAGTVHAPGIDCLAWFEIAAGLTATEFGTNLSVTRGQTATFLYRLLQRAQGVTLPTPVSGAFSDVAPGGVHTTAIETLAAFEPPILGGFQDGTYRPLDTITRQQFASVVARTQATIAAQTPLDPLPAGSVAGFTDVSPAGVHADSIGRLNTAGIMTGRTATTFAPLMELTRGQTATTLSRLLGGLVDAGVVLRPALVTGTVRDAFDANPIFAGTPMPAETVAIGGDSTRSTTTAIDGTYAVWLQQPGTYTLTVAPSGFQVYRQFLTLPGSTTVDFAMYPLGQVPTSNVVPTTSDAGDVRVTTEGDFWVIALFDDEGAAFSPQDASQIILQRADGVVVSLGAAGSSAAAWSRNPDGTSSRTGAQAGIHRLFYLVGGEWLLLEATFDANGTLIAVNGDAYSDPDASS